MRFLIFLCQNKMHVLKERIHRKSKVRQAGVGYNCSESGVDNQVYPYGIAVIPVDKPVHNVDMLLCIIFLKMKYCIFHHHFL
jgi:hypothetical protein